MCSHICDEIKYREDLLFEKAFPILKRVHRVSKDAKIQFHKRIHGLECDVVITWRSRGIYPIRSIIVELKEIDLLKMVEQLERRREFALWVYGVINLPVHEVVESILHPKYSLCDIIYKKGIGLISVFHEEPILIVRSRVISNVIAKYLENGFR